jgi:hypothetical protein
MGKLIACVLGLALGWLNQQNFMPFEGAFNN